MTDRTGIIFGNEIDEKTVRRANRAKEKFIRKYGDDSAADYRFGTEDIPALDFLGARKLVFSEKEEPLSDNPLVVGNIRMGFGHYRISIAMASCARALGYTPYWLDLAGFDATGSKMIREQNDMYSLASRISQKSWLFNHFFWEPLNSEGFRQLTYNAKDQRNSELLVPILASLPKDVPFVATHVWPSQAAVHNGMTHVVNAIPDNWPMALHLSEGAIHAVQTPFAYFGYKIMNGFAKTPLKGIPESDLRMVGRFVDHELLAGLKKDNMRRIARAKGDGPMRFLMTVGGAGAGFSQFLAMVKHLLPYVKSGRAAVFINFGDHESVFDRMQDALEVGKEMPDAVDKAVGSLNAAVGPVEVPFGRGGEQAEKAHRIRPVLLHHGIGIDDVALGFGHLAPAQEHHALRKKVAERLVQSLWQVAAVPQHLGEEAGIAQVQNGMF